MPVGRKRYVDLSTGKEVNALSIQIVADEAGKEDTNLLVGGKEDVENILSDQPYDILSEYKHEIINKQPNEAKELSKSALKKTPAKKQVTKKSK